MTSETAGLAQVPPQVMREVAESSPRSPSAMWALGTDHTAPQTVPGVYRWLLEGGLTTSHRMGRNPTSGTFSGRAIPPRRTISIFVLAYPWVKCPRHAGPWLGAPRSTRSYYSAKGRPLRGAAPHSPGGTSHLSSGQASGRALGPVGRARAAHWTLSGCWDNRPQEFRPPSLSLGEKGTELAGPAAWLLFQPPGERER